MKHKLYLIMIILSVFLFLACNKREADLRVSGNVSEFIFDEDDQVSGVIVQWEDKEIGVKITEDTYIYTWFDESLVEDFQAGRIKDIVISVDHKETPMSMEIKDGEQIAAYEAKQIHIRGYKDTESYILMDGTLVDVWHHTDATLYKFENDVTLLNVADPLGPEGIYVTDAESLEDLSENAQAKVIEYYQNRGLLYNEFEILEKAYQEYLESDKKSEFRTWMIRQETFPTASNDQTIYFMTTVVIPTEDSFGYEKRMGEAFNKETGEYISNLELFSCKQEDVLRNLLIISGDSDPELLKKLEQVFDPQSMILFPNALELSFQQSESGNYEYMHLIGFDYDEKLLEILHPWAVPDGVE